MEGIGYDFYPKTCIRQTADKWIKSSFDFSGKFIHRKYHNLYPGTWEPVRQELKYLMLGEIPLKMSNEFDHLGIE